MSKSQAILSLIGTAAKGAYDRAEASSTAKAASETSANSKEWGGADGQLTSKADDAITAAGDAYDAFNTARDEKHKQDLAAIVVMAGDVTDDVLELIAADNDLDALLETRKAAYAAAWAEEGNKEGVFTEFEAIFNA
jgi:hypothetical protein